MKNNAPPPPFIVAVDGPVGSGKSSICLEASKRLGFGFVNTGAVYRALAVVASKQGIALDHVEKLKPICDDFNENLTWDPTTGLICYKQQELNALINAEEVGAQASFVGKDPEIRQALLPVQRKWALACKKGAIVDGRDIATVVFPQAGLKVYLTASITERAKRRFEQLKKVGQTASLEVLMDQIKKRDEQDTGRVHAPLREDPEAVVLDTSSLSLEESIQTLQKLVQKRSGENYA